MARKESVAGVRRPGEACPPGLACQFSAFFCEAAVCGREGLTATRRTGPGRRPSVGAGRREHSRSVPERTPDPRPELRWGDDSAKWGGRTKKQTSADTSVPFPCWTVESMPALKNVILIAWRAQPRPQRGNPIAVFGHAQEGGLPRQPTHHAASFARPAISPPRCSLQ